MPEFCAELGSICDCLADFRMRHRAQIALERQGDLKPATVRRRDHAHRSEGTGSACGLLGFSQQGCAVTDRTAQAVGNAQIPEALTRTRSHGHRSEEHTSELQSLMRISYAVFCLKKKTTSITNE